VIGTCSGIRDGLKARASLTFPLAILSTSVIVTGCQVATPRPPDRVGTNPIIADDAMDARDWPKTEAVYPSFSVTTGSCQSLLVPKADLWPPAHAFTESGVFLANILLMPITMCQVPPWAQIETVSLYLPPTYTANPPLDPSHPNDYSGGPKGPVPNYNTAIGRQTIKTQ